MTELTFDGDTATAEVRIRIRAENAEESELHETWRFRWEGERWVLDELPAAVTARTPATVRNHKRETSNS